MPSKVSQALAFNSAGVKKPSIWSKDQGENPCAPEIAPKGPQKRVTQIGLKGVGKQDGGRHRPTGRKDHGGAHLPGAGLPCLLGHHTTGAAL